MVFWPECYFPFQIESASDRLFLHPVQGEIGESIPSGLVVTATHVGVSADEPALFDLQIAWLDLGPGGYIVILAVLVDGHGMIGIVDDAAEFGVVPLE